jgi:O-antigen ligase
MLKYVRKVWQAPMFLLFSATVLLTLASVFYSVFPFTTVVESIKYVNVFFIFTLSFILVNEKEISIKELLLAIALSAVIPICVGLIQLLSGSGINTFGVRSRIFGTFSHPNLFAFYTLFLLFLHVQFGTIQKIRYWKIHPNLRVSVYILLGILLIATYTRAAWIGLVVFLFIIGVLKYRKKLAYAALGVLSVVLVFYAVNGILKSYTEHRLEEIQFISRIVSRNEDADSISWRLTLIQENIPIIYMRPVLGYGYGTFELVWERNRSLARIWDDSAQAHNDYLRLALEMGMLGLLLYGLLLAGLGIEAFQKSNKDEHYMLLFAWIGTYAVLSLSDNMLHHTPVAWMMWAWWGAAFTKNRRASGINFLLKKHR